MKVPYLCLNKHCHLLPAFINRVGMQSRACDASAVTSRYDPEVMGGISNREAMETHICLVFVCLFICFLDILAQVPFSVNIPRQKHGGVEDGSTHRVGLLAGTESW